MSTMPTLFISAFLQHEPGENQLAATEIWPRPGGSQAAEQRSNLPALLASIFLQLKPGGEPVSRSQDPAKGMVEPRRLYKEVIRLPYW